MMTRMVSDLDVNGLSTPYLLGMGSQDDSSKQNHKFFKYNLEELMNRKNKSDSSKEQKIVNGY